MNLESHFKNKENLALNLVQAMEIYHIFFDFNPLPEGQQDYGIFNSLFYSDDPLLSQDLDGKLNFYNLGAQRVFGYTPEEAIGMLSLELVPPVLRPGRAEKFRYIIEQRTSAQVQEVRLAKGQIPIAIEALIFPYEIKNELSIAARVELLGPDGNPITNLRNL